MAVDRAGNSRQCFAMIKRHADGAKRPARAVRVTALLPTLRQATGDRRRARGKISRNKPSLTMVTQEQP